MESLPYGKVAEIVLERKCLSFQHSSLSASLGKCKKLKFEAAPALFVLLSPYQIPDKVSDFSYQQHIL